jgi:NADH-quinone oxidoreductase subunit F
MTVPQVVFGRMADPGAHTRARFVATDGYTALRRAVREMTPADVLHEVHVSGLTGRSGGSAFTTAQKWELLAPKRPAYVVVNGDESEPGTFKDRQLLERDPHQLLEGALLCAYAVGAEHVVVYVRGEAALAYDRVQTAIADARRFGAIGNRIFGSSFSCDVVAHRGAGAYVVGEESALLSSLEGERGMPRVRPPYPAVQGLYGLPTIVNNVETLSTVPWIVREGGASFGALGGSRSTGTRVFSVSGRVRRPGNYEVELHRTTFRDLIFGPELGGGIIDDRPVLAFFPGASFPWLGPEHLDLRLDIDDTAAAGSSLASGLVVLDETVCPVRVAARLVRFFATESCGKCTPCREGAPWLEKIMYRILHGAGRRADLALLSDIGARLGPGTTICALGPSTVAPITSTLSRFHDHYVAHVDLGACPLEVPARAA